MRVNKDALRKLLGIHGVGECLQEAVRSFSQEIGMCVSRETGG